MAGKLTPKLILEGTRLTFKTELAFALNEHARVVGPRRYRYHSPVISAEWCAFTNYPWGRGLINFLPEEEPQALETYRTWLRLFQLQRYYSWIVDRFHISTQVYQEQAHGRKLDFGWLEEGLTELNFRLIFCTRRAETFAAARERRLLVSGKPSQYDELERFVEEQERMRARVQASRLPWLELDVSDNDIAAAVERAADWLAASGGLEMPD
ncbi:MAG: hypothetical protein WC326_02735 [Candidatus Delongbacteria bacterium]